jgi:hypothetical protein
MRPRTPAVVAFASLSLFAAACGGGSRATTTNADLTALRQPTPDPTLDAVVRNLPRALAGAPVATPTPVPPPPPVATVAPKRPPPAPAKPANPTPTPARARR